jgi:hypothetical protein
MHLLLFRQWQAPPMLLFLMTIHTRLKAVLKLQLVLCQIDVLLRFSRYLLDISGGMGQRLFTHVGPGYGPALAACAARSSSGGTPSRSARVVG